MPKVVQRQTIEYGDDEPPRRRKRNRQNNRFARTIVILCAYIGGIAVAYIVLPQTGLVSTENQHAFWSIIIGVAIGLLAGRITR
jgi:NhaP-type Na+/H+ or K+/H+ antiporter